jgi:2-polyprenyl-6-methoxyphenol hydroxylase-like FAD-dependent oxidoreductase
VYLDQGQGGGAAIEDAAAISAVMPAGTTPEDIPERLKLYEQIRYDRAHVIQEYSRQAGRDPAEGKPEINSKWRLLGNLLHTANQM